MSTQAETAEAVKTETSNVEVNSKGTFDTRDDKSNYMDKYVYMDEVNELLNIGFDTKTNLLLFGKGGHGKSDMAVDFLKSKGITPYIQTMGSGMSIDRLFGGIDLRTFEGLDNPATKGKIQYLVENSFMNYEYVVFEELFDAPDFILEQLKDILSSGIYRNGSQQFNIKTKFIVCNTNRTREEYATDNSIKALMERFPLEWEVKWTDYTAANYDHLLTTVLGKTDSVLTYIMEEYHSNGITISPRIAIKAAQLFFKCGMSCLKFIAEFSKKPEIFKKALKKYEDLAKIRNLMEDIIACEEELKKVNFPGLTSSSEIADVKKSLARFGSSIKALSVLKVDDEHITKKAEFEKKYNEAYTKYNNGFMLIEQLDF